MPIMYRNFACHKKVSRLNFWTSDLSLLAFKEQPEYSASCRGKQETVFNPRACLAENRKQNDYAVIVTTFVEKKHFCNFTLPKQIRENVLLKSQPKPASPELDGLVLLQASPPSAFNVYYADLPPNGQGIVMCSPNEVSCKLNAVTEAGDYLLEISFPSRELINWRALLAKTESVASKCRQSGE